MLPGNWVNTILSEIILGDIKNGYSPNPPEKDEGYWVLSLGALTGELLDLTQIKPAPKNSKVLATRLYKDDFLISRSNTQDKVGRTARYQGGMLNLSYPDLMMRFRADKDKVDPIWLEVFLKSGSCVLYFRRNAVGSSATMVKINKKIVSCLPILLPTFPEQQKIARILSIWDAAVNCAQKLLENSKQQKKALMQQLLTGKQRLPGFSKEWTKYTLKEMGTFTKGSGLPKEHLRSTGELYAIPYTSIFTDFKEVFKESDISKYVSRSHEGLTTRNKACLLFASSSNMLENIGKCAGYTGKKEVAIGGDVIIFDTAQNISFLAYLFARRCHRNNFLRLSQGSTIRHLYPHQLEMYQVFMPPLPEQTAIVQVLSAAEAVIGRYEIKLANLQSQKKVLMQQLLTGKKRVILHDSQEACQ